MNRLQRVATILPACLMLSNGARPQKGTLQQWTDLQPNYNAASTATQKCLSCIRQSYKCMRCFGKSSLPFKSQHSHNGTSTVLPW
jgi:hypothetical protein